MAIEGRGHSLRELRSIQDWFIRYQLNSVPGVAGVASVGGVVRQYQIDFDPKRLRAFKILLSAVVDAVMRSNRNVGGNVVEASGMWSVIRGLGLVESVKDLEHVVIGAEQGVPIFIRQVAEVKVGDAFRVAARVKGEEEAVGGVVVARHGASTIEVITRVKNKIAALQVGWGGAGRFTGNVAGWPRLIWCWLGRKPFRKPFEFLTACGSSGTVTAVMNWRRAMTLAALVVLVILPPVAMAFGGCAGMAQMCEAPCGASACAAFAPRDSMAPGLVVARVEVPPALHQAVITVPSLDPPPKLSLLSA